VNLSTGKVAGGDAEQRPEPGVAGSTAVKAEHELVEVGLQMGAAQTVVDAQGSDFEIGENAVDQGRTTWAAILPMTCRS
jgi:hypothetical protein